MKFKEEDIRPQSLMDEYISKSIQDIKVYFNGKRSNISCPACGVNEADEAFKKFNFLYVVLAL